jgi:decaprenylphospho-beta-D-ribofuranose 2-oxidase
MRNVKRTGWGRTSSSESACFPIQKFSEFRYSDSVKSGLGVGLGRSYGDSSINSQGIHITSEYLTEISIDVSTKIVECGSGVTIGDLERVALQNGLFPPTVPGTEFVTIGGAVASNIHGKGHHKFGSFAEGLLEVKLLKSNGTICLLNPSHSEFWATVGGMGLTGFILSAKFKLISVETSYINVREKKAKSLTELINTLDDFSDRYTYSVAWIDLSGKFKGRGIVSGGNHALISEIPKKYLNNCLRQQWPKKLRIPDIFPAFFINSFTVKIFNNLWYLKMKSRPIVHSRKFLHPLDSIKNWNRIYGKSGFIEYQFQIPSEKVILLYEVLNELKLVNGYSFLGVVKKFGNSNNNYLSFASSGYTFSVDLPAPSPAIIKTLAKLDRRIIDAGGRVYLTKDSRLQRGDFNEMYPQLNEWKVIKENMDPNNFWQSDQGRRLGLC